MKDTRICGCENCQNKLPFDLPNEIIEATIKGDLVIFAGAGTSTEAKGIFPASLYDEIAFEVNSEKELDFPNLMSAFCSKKPNGRQKLLQKIKNRVDYCHQFQELYGQATDFHKELSSIYHIKSIITTNWDDFFEREAGAIPIVIPEDFAFYDLPDRKVYKIHGSISNYGTVVATKEDYDKCYKELNRGIIGSYLKLILATKTVVFVGYSFKDYDFIRIYDYLKKELKELLPHCYIVSVNPGIAENLNIKNLTVINTSGAYFLSALREHLENSNYLFPKENLENVYKLKMKHFKIHEDTAELLSKYKFSNVAYCLMYQDGISHALSYLMHNASNGLTFYPHRIFNSIDNYEKLRKDKLKIKNYPDVAYIDGYIIALHSILTDNIDDFPFYYVFGLNPIFKEHDFLKIIKKNEIFHKTAEAKGIKKFSEIFKNPDLVLHHTPFL